GMRSAIGEVAMPSIDATPGDVAMPWPSSLSPGEVAMPAPSTMNEVPGEVAMPEPVDVMPGEVAMPWPNAHCEISSSEHVSVRIAPRGRSKVRGATRRSAIASTWNATTYGWVSGVEMNVARPFLSVRATHENEVA